MINFLGDVYLDKPYKIDIELGDFILNLEYPLSCKGTPAKDKVNLCQSKCYLKQTFGKFPLAVCLANNHIMDYGEEAFLKTISYLDSNNIKYFGAGNKENNFNNPCTVELNGKTIAIFGYTCPSTHPVFGTHGTNGSALLEEREILNDIKKIRDSVDFIVIQLHWGDEEIKYPKPDDVKKARAFVDAGADLIIGHHAHVIQSHEVYNKKNIYYGLGNFLFPNLSVSSNFNGNIFESTYKKRQNNQNRESIIIHMNKDFNIDMSVTYFDDHKVVVTDKIIVPKWIPSTEESYMLYYSLWLKKKKIQNFLTNPKPPTIKQLIRFFK